MGFFSGLSRLIQGKPMYEPGDIVRPGQVPPPADQPPQPQPNGQQPAQAQGPKIVPVVRIGRVECPVNGQRMEVYGDIRNESQIPILLDRVMLLGATRQLDRTLNPGESHQFLLYSGAPLTALPNGYADVQYRTMNSDYFSARHQIRVHELPNHTYLVTEFLLQMPINDMH